MGRLILRTWARTGRKAARHYHAVEKWGARIGNKSLRARLPNGCDIICDDLDDVIQRHIYFRGTFEPVEAYLFVQLLDPGMTVVDAGANIGQYTMLAATVVGAAGAVHSFEPIPSTFARLQTHVAGNGLTNVKLNRMALWNEDCPVKLKLPAQTTSATGGWSIGEKDSPSAAIEAEAIRLDTYAMRCGLSRVDVIKMDIEGAEPFAIAGARDLLERCHPTLLMEVNRRCLSRFGASPEKLWEQLRALGYRAWRIGYSLATSGPVENLNGVELTNFLFHHRDLPKGVTSGWHRRDPRRWACSGW